MNYISETLLKLYIISTNFFENIILFYKYYYKKIGRKNEIYRKN